MDEVLSVALRLPPELANTLSSLCDLVLHMRHEIEGLRVEVGAIKAILDAERTAMDAVLCAHHANDRKEVGDDDPGDLSSARDRAQSAGG